MATPSVRAPQPGNEKGRLAGRPSRNLAIDTSADSTLSADPQCAVGHTIVIDHEAFGAGFDVKIVPPAKGYAFDRECPSYRFARTYARGIRLHRGWPIDDRTGGDA